MAPEPIPFPSVTDTLQDNLRQKHLARVASWLIGSQPTGVLAQVCNSNWETALTIDFLVSMRSLFTQTDEEKKLAQDIETRVPEAASRLLAEAKATRHSNYGDMVCWEGVTWDTAVTMRALVTAVKAFPTGFSDSRREDIEQVIMNSVQWLAWRFDVWDTDVKFPFGASDIAQILMTLVYLRVERPDLLRAAESTGYLATRKGRVLEADIVHYLLKEATSEQVSHREADSADGHSEQCSWWGNFFHTAEVLEALSLAYAATQDAAVCPDPGIAGKLKGILSDEDAKAAKTTALAALRYLETHQANGEWGSHVDTLRCLDAYVRATFLLKDDPEPHLVFRALRWACDDKQVFSDGSLMHTMFLTIFYALALKEIHEHWGLAKKPLFDVYDDVVWASPARTTCERGKRLKAEMGRDDCARANRDLEWKASKNIRVCWSIIAVIVAMVLGLSIGHLFEIAVIVSPIVQSVTDVLTLWAVVVAVCVSVVTLIWTVSRR